MKTTQLFLSTLREVPAEAEVISHQLMLRASLIRKLASGVYTLLPLGYRVIKKIENIIRQEMDRQGAQELLLPALQPAELWQESGRWQYYGPELMRLKDRHERDFCLGPTHEEVITDLVRREIKSYRQLPLNLYQIQTKFRDEIRPRFGLMRGREFIMKDAYSFDKDQAGLNESYNKMHEAYCRIFERCGLDYRAVEADSGAIGGSSSHEFMVLAETGEDAVAYCSACQYSANVEKADYYYQMPDFKEPPEEIKELDTPGVHTIEEISAFLGVQPNRTIKTLIANTEKETIAVLLRGDRELNEVKLKNLLGVNYLTLAGPEVVENVTGAGVGFAGPIGLKGIRLIADREVMDMHNAVTGANRTDKHFCNVNPGRDFAPDVIGDVRMVIPGDLCPHCQGQMKIVRGIEVGHIFKLGTKYSKNMKAAFVDEDGQEKLFVMGCYGIGVGRTMAAAIEQNNDENGIIWPFPIAPFHVIIIPVQITDEVQRQYSQRLYEKLLSHGIEVLLDDRDERGGVKFKDADLIGIPLRVTVGGKSLSRGVVEIKDRRTGAVEEIPAEGAEEYIIKIVNDNLKF